MPVSSLYRAATLALGEDVGAWLRAEQRDGQAVRALAASLTSRCGFPVSSETCRKWAMTTAEDAEDEHTGGAA